MSYGPGLQMPALTAANYLCIKNQKNNFALKDKDQVSNEKKTTASSSCTLSINYSVGKQWSRLLQFFLSASLYLGKSLEACISTIFMLNFCILPILPLLKLCTWGSTYTNISIRFISNIVQKAS